MALRVSDVLWLNLKVVSWDQVGRMGRPCLLEHTQEKVAALGRGSCSLGGPSRPHSVFP